MNHLAVGKIALFCAEQDRDAVWYEEAAAHSGLLYEPVNSTCFERLSQWQVLLLCGRGRLTGDQQAALRRWVEFGGCVVASGSAWGMEEDFGLHPSRLPSFSQGRMHPPKQPSPLASELLPSQDEGLLFFGGARVHEKGAQVYARGPESEALASVNGRWLWFAPHVGMSLRVILMGRSVECDGIGPGDGTAVLEDGLKRAEDGTSLSFSEDRKGGLFATPWADLLIDAWTRLVLKACDLGSQAVLLTAPWPSGFHAAATVSIDCDSSTDEPPRRMASHLAKFGIKAGWIAPHAGLAKDLSRTLKGSDHSFGLAYLPPSGEYSEDSLKLQMMQAGRQFGASLLACSRPADGEWTGWDRYYEMLAKVGTRASLAKGGRQAGTSGFLFGSASPFVPRLSEKGLPPVLEIPYHACLPATPDSALPVLAEEVSRQGGCLHVVVNLVGTQEMDLDRSVINLNMALRQKKLLLLTPDQAALFTLGMRSLSFGFADQILQVFSNSSLPGATFLTDPSFSLASLNGAVHPRPLTRFGRTFSAWSFDIQAKTRLSLKLDQRSRAA